MEDSTWVILGARSVRIGDPTVIRRKPVPMVEKHNIFSMKMYKRGKRELNPKTRQFLWYKCTMSGCIPPMSVVWIGWSLLEAISPTTVLFTWLIRDKPLSPRMVLSTCVIFEPTSPWMVLSTCVIRLPLSPPIVDSTFEWKKFEDIELISKYLNRYLSSLLYE